MFYAKANYVSRNVTKMLLHKCLVVSISKVKYNSYKNIYLYFVKSRLTFLYCCFIYLFNGRVRVTFVWPYTLNYHSTLAVCKDDLGWYCRPNICSCTAKCLPAYNRSRSGFVHTIIVLNLEGCLFATEDQKSFTLQKIKFSSI